MSAGSRKAKALTLGAYQQAYEREPLPVGYPPAYTGVEGEAAGAFAVTIPVTAEQRRRRIVWPDFRKRASTGSSPWKAVDPLVDPRLYTGPAALETLVDSVLGPSAASRRLKAGDSPDEWPYYWVNEGSASVAVAIAAEGATGTEKEKEAEEAEAEEKIEPEGTAPSTPGVAGKRKAEHDTGHADDDGGEPKDRKRSKTGSEAEAEAEEEASRRGTSPSPSSDLVILPYFLSSPFLRPSIVQRYIPLLRDGRVACLSPDDLATLAPALPDTGAATGATSATTLTAMCARGLGLPLVRGDPKKPSPKTAALRILPAYLYRLPFACTSCPAGCLVAKTGPLQWRRDIRAMSARTPDDADGGCGSAGEEDDVGDLADRADGQLWPVVEVYCFRSAARKIPTTWIVKTSRVSGAGAGGEGVELTRPGSPGPTYRVRRLFARVVVADGDAASGSDPAADICLDPVWSEVDAAGHPSLTVRLQWTYPGQSRAQYRTAWHDLLPFLPLWATPIGVPPTTSRLIDAVTTAARSARGPAPGPDAWAKLFDRYRSFGAKCHPSNALPHGKHLVAGFRIPAAFAACWAPAQALFAAELASRRGRKSEYTHFEPNQEYFQSQMAMLAMQSWTDALSAGCFGQNSSAQPSLHVEPFDHGGSSAERAEWLRAFEARIRPCSGPSATDRGPLFYLGFILHEQHYVAWHACHKSRTAYLYDGNVLSPDTWLNPIADVIDRCRGAAGGPSWSFQNRPLVAQRVEGMCGPWTSYVIHLCLRHAEQLQHNSLSPSIEPAALRNAFWAQQDNVDAVRFVQAAGLIAHLEDGIRIADHLWHARPWTSAAPPSANPAPITRVDDELYPVIPETPPAPEAPS